MKDIQGSQTERNLLAAFAGESQAALRYQFYAKAAKKEGFEQISEIFAKTAVQEQAHAKRFFRCLQGGHVEITASYPAGKIGTTLENLQASATGENEEWTEMYPAFAKTAAEEGFADISAIFKLVAKVEAQHERRFNRLLERVKDGSVFEREEDVCWVCRKCGYVHTGKTPPKTCPACLHPTAYFEIEAINY